MRKSRRNHLYASYRDRHIPLLHYTTTSQIHYTVTEGEAGAALAIVVEGVEAQIEAEVQEVVAEVMVVAKAGAGVGVSPTCA